MTDYLTGNLHEQLEKRKLELRFPPENSSIKDLRDESIDPMAQTNRKGSALESEVLSYVDDGTYTFLKAQIHRIERCLEHIQRVDENDYEILELFYRDKRNWIYIEQKVHLSERQCRRRRNKSLKELAKWI